MPSPVFTAFDANGDPIPGALLHTLEVGTTNPKVSYADTEGTENDNPVICDAAGRAVVYVKPAPYKYRLELPSGALVWEQDQVLGPATLAAYFLAAYPSLTAALSAIGSDTATLIVDEVVAVTENATIPSTVHVQFYAPGALDLAVGVTVTVQGGWSSGRYRCLTGGGTVDLTDAKLDWVYPEWWGAVSLKAATGTPEDSTAAIDAAIGSFRNVLFDQGIYGSTGGHHQRHDGQVVRGQGIMLLADGQGGTVLYRLSGTTPLYKLGAFIGMSLEQLTFDGNGLGGNLLQVSATLYSRLDFLRFRGQGGTDYALYIDRINTSKLSNLSFEDGNYGNIQTNGAKQQLYSLCENITMGNTNGGYGWDVQNATSWTWLHCHSAAPLRTGSNCSGLRFFNYNGEYDEVDVPWVTIDSTANDVLFDGGYSGHATNATVLPVFDLVGACRNVTIRNYRVADSISLAGRPIVRLNGCVSPTLENIHVRSTLSNSFTLVQGVTAASTDVKCTNVRQHTGSAGTMEWYATRLILERLDAAQSFVVGTSQSITLHKVTGAVTRTNAGRFTLIDTDDAEQTLSVNDATPDIAAGRLWVSANTVPTTITDLDNALGIVDGDEVMILLADANTTFDLSANANMKGNGGVDFTGSGGWVRARAINNVWYCECFTP